MVCLVLYLIVSIHIRYVTVEGFYHKAVPATLQEKEMIKRIPYDRSDDMILLGTTPEAGDTSFSALERVWYCPTVKLLACKADIQPQKVIQTAFRAMPWQGLLAGW
jgi:hypothetical protein